MHPSKSEGLQGFRFSYEILKNTPFEKWRFGYKIKIKIFQNISEAVQGFRFGYEIKKNLPNRSEGVQGFGFGYEI